MQIIARKRTDAPLKPGEIEIVPANVANAPRRIAEAAAVPSLRRANQKAIALAAEIAAKNAELQAERSKAVEIQMAHDELKSRRAAIIESITRAEFELESCKGRLTELAEQARAVWTSRGIHDHAAEAVNRSYLVEHLPAWIAADRAALAEVEAELAAFNRANN